MEKIREQEKSNNFDHVYLLYGAEQAVVKIYRNKILKGLLGTDSIAELKQDMNFSIFIGTPLDVDSVVGMASSYPFMAEKRVVLIENAKLFSKGGSNANALIECVKNLPETTYMIFVDGEVADKKGLYAAIKEVGHIAEINEQDRAFVEKWVLRQFMNDNKRISRAAMDELLVRAGLDIMRLTNEIAKVVAYKGDETDVMLEDITAVVSEEPQEKVFKMIDGISNKNINEAMKHYYDLLELKVSPQKILANMEGQIKILYQVKDMRKKGYPEKAIMERVKIRFASYISKYIRQAGKFSQNELQEFLDDIVSMTLESRTGGISDRMAVEMLIVKYSSWNQ